MPLLSVQHPLPPAAYAGDGELITGTRSSELTTAIMIIMVRPRQVTCKRGTCTRHPFTVERTLLIGTIGRFTPSITCEHISPPTREVPRRWFTSNNGKETSTPVSVVTGYSRVLDCSHRSSVLLEKSYPSVGVEKLGRYTFASFTNHSGLFFPG